MKTEPLVYIVLLNYNNSADTIECFKSLQNITYTNYKIVIIDNNSPNNSMDYFIKYMDDNNQNYIYHKSKDEATTFATTHKNFISLIQSGHNGGYGSGNNIGIKYALNNNADYVLILNNDTIVDQHFLEPLVEICEKDQKVGIVSGKIFFYDNPDTIWFNGGKFNPWTASIKHFHFKEKDIGQKPSSEITFISGCLILIPRMVIEKVGLINEDYFMYLEDLEFCHRILQNDYKLDIAFESKVWHKKDVSSHSRLSQQTVFYSTMNKIKFIIANARSINKITSIIYILIIVSFRYLYIKRFDLLKAHIKGILHSRYK